MKGNNTLTFNEATMREIVEYYLKAKVPLLLEDSIVSNIIERVASGIRVFEISLSAEED